MVLVLLSLLSLSIPLLLLVPIQMKQSKKSSGRPKLPFDVCLKQWPTSTATASCTGELAPSYPPESSLL